MFEPLFHRPILAIFQGRIGYCPLSAMSGRRPLAVRNVANPRCKYNYNLQYSKYPNHLFCIILCLYPTSSPGRIYFVLCHKRGHSLPS